MAIEIDARDGTLSHADGSPAIAGYQAA